MKRFYVYILCNKRNGTLYTGITSYLIKRIYEHKNNLVEGFTRKYNIHCLVWYEIHETAEAEYAISREKQIKAWKRQWKLRLIEKNNAEWNDLYDIISEDTGFLPEFIPYLIRGGNDTIREKSLTLTICAQTVSQMFKMIFT